MNANTYPGRTVTAGHQRVVVVPHTDRIPPLERQASRWLQPGVHVTIDDTATRTVRRDPAHGRPVHWVRDDGTACVSLHMDGIWYQVNRHPDGNATVASIPARGLPKVIAADTDEHRRVLVAASPEWN